MLDNFIRFLEILQKFAQEFQHNIVNHNYNFVDPSIGAHTQNIEKL